MLLLMDEYVLKPHFIYLHLYVYPSSLPSFLHLLFIHNFRVFIFFSFGAGPPGLLTLGSGDLSLPRSWDYRDLLSPGGRG